MSQDTHTIADTHGPRPAPRTHLLACLAVLWLIAVALGVSVMLGYDFGAGVAADASARWPADSRIEPAADRATLVLFAHPRCPCTRATVGELSRILAQSGAPLDVIVLFYRPADAPDAWARTDIWESAAAIPGARVLVDADGAEARRFGAKTSGQALLYERGGRLVFSGGITSARGHAGESAGADAVLALLSGHAAAAAAPVFGCSILDPERCR